jgi:hypothetical protein
MKKTRLLSPALILCATGALAACSGSKAVNIGNTNAIGSQLSDYAATWDGYAEAYTFMPDGSDHVRLTIGPDGQGTLQVGNQAPIAPATDPNVGYPPGVDYTKSYFQNPPIWEGIVYPVYSAQVQTDRIQVGVKPNDYFASWCALQTPFAYVTQITGGTLDGGPPGTVYTQSIVPVDGGAPDASGVMYLACPFQGGDQSTLNGVSTCYGELGPVATEVDCGKYYLCNENVCACTAAGCTSSPLVAAGSPPSQYPVELDAALDNNGQTLTGTLLLSADLRITVVLQKQ